MANCVVASKDELQTLKSVVEASDSATMRLDAIKGNGILLYNNQKAI